MSKSITFNFTPVGGTGAGLGRSAGGHMLIADRPAGTAGGSGLGFNGGELLAASLGGCFWNDLHYAAQGSVAFQVPEFSTLHDLGVDTNVDVAETPSGALRERPGPVRQSSDRRLSLRTARSER